MDKKPSSIKQIRRLWNHLKSRRRNQVRIFATLSIFVSCIEVVSISSVLPFLVVLTSPEKVFTHELLQPLAKVLQLQSAQDLPLPLTVAFVLLAIIAGLARITLYWVQTRLAVGISSDFSVQVYDHMLYQPYNFHISRNTSEIISGVQKAAGLVSTTLQPTFTILSSLVILVAITTTLIVIQPVASISALIGLGFSYAAIVMIAKSYIARNGVIIAIHHSKITKAIQEGLGGIRDIIIDGTQPVYSKIYINALYPMRLALANNQVIASSPRFGIEALCMGFIAGATYVLYASGGGAGGVTDAIPVMGFLALGMQKILPVLQQIYSSYITISGNRASTQDVLDLLDEIPNPHSDAQTTKPIDFTTLITLKGISFRYSQHSPWILKNINLEIRKGSRVGFVGVTGSGKSSLMDIVMGILTPSEGALVIDNAVINNVNTRAWQTNISHVPQEIYLFDASVLENIAVGVPVELIDFERVQMAAEKAQIAKTIDRWPDGYKTVVGERGVRLSGGQRQRIGIARALYKRANLIVLDEATSALDNETETAVMDAIESLGRGITILIIAHRLTTLKRCDQIVELKKGQITSISDYEKMMGQRNEK